MNTKARCIQGVRAYCPDCKKDTTPVLHLIDDTKGLTKEMEIHCDRCNRAIGSFVFRSADHKPPAASLKLEEKEPGKEPYRGLAHCSGCGAELMAPNDGRPYWCIACSQKQDRR